MNQKRLWIAATIIAIVIIIGFVISVPHTTRDVVEKPVEKQVPVVPPVTLHDVFKKGTHTITGSVEAPNACTVVHAQASLIGDASSTQSILVALSLPSNTGVCLQLPTRIDFGTTIVAPTHLPIRATVNGSLATTTSS